MALKGSTVEREMARIAGAAHWVVSRAQLLRAGISVDEIRYRLRTGALIPEFRGVYRVGHRAPSLEARYLAAVRACGDRALLAGRAAARLFDLSKRGAPPPELITPTQRRVPGVRTRRSRRIDPREAITWKGIPVTAVARTLVDVAAELPTDEMARVCHEAQVRYGTTPDEIEAVLDRRPRSPGARKLRRIMRGG